MAGKWSRRAVLAGGISAAFVAVQTGGAQASEGPLRIGILDPNLGAGYRVDAINLEGGHGHAAVIELLSRETGGDPAKTRDAVASLLEQGVHALIGPGTGWASDIVAQIAQASCTPLVNPNPGNASGLPYVFAAGPAPEQVNRAVLQTAKKDNHPKLGVLAPEKLSTPDGAAAVERFPLSATDLVAPIKSLAAQKPDVLVILAPPPFDAMALRDALVAGWTGPVLLTPSAANPGVTGPLAEGARMVAPWLAAAKQAPEALPQTTTMRRFVSGFESEHGTPGTQMGAGADAVSLLHLAFLGHRDRKMARAELEQMCCLGVCGVYNITADNHAGLSPDALVPMTMVGGVWTVDKS